MHEQTCPSLRAGQAAVDQTRPEAGQAAVEQTCLVAKSAIEQTRLVITVCCRQVAKSAVEQTCPCSKVCYRTDMSRYHSLL
jgi:hypothetical protein